jgi:hypothetical protein
MKNEDSNKGPPPPSRANSNGKMDVDGLTNLIEEYEEQYDDNMCHNRIQTENEMSDHD